MDLSSVTHITLIEVRLPMVLMAIIAGASLAISGLLLQRVTQNPLACPSLSGVEYGTACCVILSYMFIPHISKLGMMCISLMGGLLTYLLTQAIVKKTGATTTGIILIGIAFDALYFSLIQAILLAFPYQAQSILYDLNGSLLGVTFYDIGLISLPFMVLFAGSLLLGRRLDLLNLDELQASALGVAIKPYRLTLLAISIILATLVTSLIGPLLFFSLIVPHLVRSMTSCRYIILFCAIYGAALLLMAQLLTQLISPMTPPPVGLVMLLIAAPMLTIIIRRYLPYDER
jgi:iron complex transport system permease protein